MHVNDIGLGIEMIVPDIFQQHGTRDDVAGIAHEILQQLEFAGLEEDRLAGAGNGAGQEIDFKIGRPQPRCRELRSTLRAAKAFDAGEKFGKCIRFGEIVVAPGPQPRTRSSTSLSALRIRTGVRCLRPASFG